MLDIDRLPMYMYMCTTNTFKTTYKKIPYSRAVYIPSKNTPIAYRAYLQTSLTNLFLVFVAFFPLFTSIRHSDDILIKFIIISRSHSVTENVNLKQFSVICEGYIQNKLIVICGKVSNVTRVIYEYWSGAFLFFFFFAGDSWNLHIYSNLLNVKDLHQGGARTCSIMSLWYATQCENIMNTMESK